MCARRRYPATGEEHDERRDRAILVGVDLGGRSRPVEDALAELERLTDTAGAEVVGVVTQRLAKPNPRTFIGAGKVEEIVELALRTEANLVIFDDDLSPRQQANVQDLIGDARVIDRTALILEIFALHATTREGKLQVELAQKQYLLPRLRGMWSHLDAERLGGGRGARFGAGESQLETDRRLARRRIAELKRELANVSAERDLQRKRRARSGVVRVALVGYTNAGKSTLLNALTGAGVLTADMLFATLDSTTRRFMLPEGREVTVTDTVGFIDKLPHGLIEAFKSTLDEVREADLLLHVVDASAAEFESHMRAVGEVLQEIEAHTRPALPVFNKSDLLDDAARARLTRKYPSAVFLSAKTGEGMDTLVSRIIDEAARGSETVDVLIPFTKGELVQLAHERASVLTESHTEAGTLLRLRVSAEFAATFEPYAIDPSSEPAHE